MFKVFSRYFAYGWTVKPRFSLGPNTGVSRVILELMALKITD
ncbi:hypothetical protein N9M01_09740 [Luminiphilus sp.]|nr:hypothetical protein [Luminiphilus sp.]